MNPIVIAVALPTIPMRRRRSCARQLEITRPWPLGNNANMRKKLWRNIIDRNQIVNVA